MSFAVEKVLLHLVNSYQGFSDEAKERELLLRNVDINRDIFDTPYKSGAPAAGTPWETPVAMTLYNFFRFANRSAALTMSSIGYINLPSRTYGIGFVLSGVKIANTSAAAAAAAASGGSAGSPTVAAAADDMSIGLKLTIANTTHLISIPVNHKFSGVFTSGEHPISQVVVSSQQKLGITLCDFCILQTEPDKKPKPRHKAQTGTSDLKILPNLVESLPSATGFMANMKKCADAVGLVRADKTMATGFLISPYLLVTTSHCLPDAKIATGATVAFESDTNNQKLPDRLCTLDPSQFFLTSKDGWTVVALGTPMIRAAAAAAATATKTAVAVATKPLAVSYPTEFVSLASVSIGNGTVKEKVPVFLIGHPLGLTKRITVGNAFSGGGVVYYDNLTDGGSGGSPIFDGEWKLIGLHIGAGKFKSLASTFPPMNSGCAATSFVASLKMEVAAMKTDKTLFLQLNLK